MTTYVVLRNICSPFVAKTAELNFEISRLSQLLCVRDSDVDVVTLLVR